MRIQLNKIPTALLGITLLFAAACKKDLAPAPGASNNSASKLGTNAIGVSGPKGVCYVEVNNNDIRNVGNYTLSTGQQLFDVAIIFAANINYNTTTQKAELFFNPQVTNVLSNASTYIQPLQAKGIKVMLSILGNHQGAGISNFPTQAAAQDFAQLLSNAVTTYGLDGIDFDDEYADYGNNGTGQPNSSSFVYLVTALRQLMPTKLISFYYYGPAASRLSFNGVTVGSKVDYSWNAVYGSYSVPNVPGLAKSNLGPAAIDIQSTSSTTAASLATQTVNNSYGIYLYYNLPNTDVHTYLTSVSNKLYGKTTVYTGTVTPPTTGVTFYQDINYGGTVTTAIPKGTYTLAQLQAYGMPDNWASSVKIPTGWTVTMYTNDNFTGTSWTRTANTPNFTTLFPNANDVVTSVKIQ
ncbi:endo-beta-N-acetylglucosaminidase H [Mucilaginibacter aquaedulcis]|uniref:endo-beta-N-acetylglucosaminidase H n=1 Tax=Mucilaginibacter aquaedulcis TaxID=1187081 RepID=UPI0025B2E5C8|nr:endo-beta-N-acetylglucosaminidase H [Mucilaginibacter aquaedulcis]MDN3549856.1 glycosyl hydrolase family 18 protein [Mucilaginibacter aquaedulcis]